MKTINTVALVCTAIATLVSIMVGDWYGTGWRAMLFLGNLALRRWC